MEDPLPYDEEFLYHLSRGSEFLVANRVGEAKEELERALVVQPRDSKGQDLLAGVYFRLGVYPRAIELWTTLVDQHPDDVPLRVNLGLALLKTAQVDEAVVHLTRATELDESHGRAWGYLGLALWRLGKLDRAREAFLRGGQASMVRRMEEMLSTTGAGSLAPSLSVVPPPPEEPAASERRPSMRPRSAGPDELEPAIAAGGRLHPKTRDDTLESWAPRRTPAKLLELTDGGLLCITPRESDVLVARTLLLAVRGEGSEGRSPAVRVRAGQDAVAGPPEGHALHVLRLAEGEILYLVERYLGAFEAVAGGEVRSLEVAGGALRIVQLRGAASVALVTGRRPVALPSRGEPLSVGLAHLVGWSGRLFPATTGSGDALVLRGEGTVLVA
jgi:hypothetical protein